MPVGFAPVEPAIRASCTTHPHADGAWSIKHACSWCMARSVSEMQQFLAGNAPIAGHCTRTRHTPYYNLYAYSIVFRPSCHAHYPTQATRASLA